MLVDPGILSDAERAERNIQRLPASLPAALDALEDDTILLENLGDLLGRSFLAVRRSEAATFPPEPTDAEFDRHFYIY